MKTINTTSQSEITNTINFASLDHTTNAGNRQPVRPRHYRGDEKWLKTSVARRILGTKTGVTVVALLTGLAGMALSITVLTHIYDFGYKASASEIASLSPVTAIESEATEKKSEPAPTEAKPAPINIVDFAAIKQYPLVKWNAETGADAAAALTNQWTQVADAASLMQAQGMNFDQIFKVLCAQAAAQSADPKVDAKEKVRALFNGLWMWTSERGGKPSLQNRSDWPLHFIAGGMTEGNFGMGRTAAVAKEAMDVHATDNFFDLDDMAVTMLGARWMEVALEGDSNQARRWLAMWGNGRLTIERSLPTLRYGHLQPGVQADAATIQSIRREMDASLFFMNLEDVDTVDATQTTESVVQLVSQTVGNRVNN